MKLIPTPEQYASFTLTGPSVPTGPDSSKERFAYISAYQDALLQLRDKLADSVRHIHLFFAGPGPLVGIITAMFKTKR